MLELDIPIHFSCQATTIDPDGDQSFVRFDDGRFIAPDLIIGADGRMNSIARQFITGDSRPGFQRFLNWIGIAPHGPARSEAGTICDYWGVGARFGIVPVSNDTVYWAGGVAIDKEHFEDTAEDIDHLRSTFDGWPAPVRDIVSQNVNDETVQPFKPTIHGGRNVVWMECWASHSHSSLASRLTHELLLDSRFPLLNDLQKCISRWIFMSFVAAHDQRDCRRGSNGVVLESSFLGGRRFFSIESGGGFF